MPVDDNPYAEYAVYPDDQPLRPTQTRNDSLRDMVYPQGPISPVTQPPPKDFQGVHQTPPMASHAYASLPTQTPSPRGQPTAATPKISLTRSESQGTSKSIETNDSGAPIIPSHPSHIPMPPIPDHDRVHFHSASRSSSHGRKEEKSNEKLDALRPPTGLHRYTDRSPPALTRTNSPAWPPMFIMLNMLICPEPMRLIPICNSPLATLMQLISASRVVRWAFFIIPILALLWIPGIIGVTAATNATVWSVKLIWWSIWLSVVWVGWWGSWLTAMILPNVLRGTIGVVAPELLHYITYLQNLDRYVGLAIWALVNWISFQPIVSSHTLSTNSTDGNQQVLHKIVQGLFAITLGSFILSGEKLFVQVIARNFHKKSYEDRILVQKHDIGILVTLYANSHDIGRTDTMDHTFDGITLASSGRYIKKALRGVKKAAQTGATAIGTVASEIAGERLLQPNSPASMVTAALSSSNKSRQLARRIFFSFVPSGRRSLILSDVLPFFASREAAGDAFAVLDRDGNGDVELDEIELACLEIHRERLALASSMKDLDSAVGRLDSILFSVAFLISILVFIALLDVSFSTLITASGTFILGLSWLIGATAQEILSSIIFLFIKHAYDVSDRVDIDGVAYVVKEMHLLSTIFRGTDGKVTQIPHSVLNAKAIVNIRRSGPIAESFSWDVDFGTSFDKIQALRDRMLEFLEAERRDFLPKIDISIADFAGQALLTLKADIAYKNNWQNGALKAQRRNKWLCALRIAMSQLEIFGPGGAGNPKPAPDPQLIKIVPNEPAPAYTTPPQTAEAGQAEAQAAKRMSSTKEIFEDPIFDGPNARKVDPVQVMARPTRSNSKSTRPTVIRPGESIEMGQRP